MITLLLLLLSLPLSAQFFDLGTATDGFEGNGSKVYSVPVSVMPQGLTDRTMRFCTSCTFHVPVTPGTYNVTLRVLEPALPGQTDLSILPKRVFSATVNGQLVIDKFTPQPSATFNVMAISKGFIDVVLTTQVRSAVLSSIEITPNLPMASTKIRAGDGIIVTQAEGSDVMTVMVDTSYVQFVERFSYDPEPVPGEGCNYGAGVAIFDNWVYFCVAVKPPSPNPNPWGRWRRARLEPL